MLSAEIIVTIFEMTSAHHRKCKDPITVERRLKVVCKKLNAEEVNIGLFHRMLKAGVATNDVRNFTNNQLNQKHSTIGTDASLSRVAMKQKLKDAYSTAGVLRREKKELKEVLLQRIGYSKSKKKGQ